MNTKSPVACPVCNSIIDRSWCSACNTTVQECQHCHKGIVAATLPRRCPHCDAGTICSGATCMYCRVLNAPSTRCTKPKVTSGGIHSVKQLRAYMREAFCENCSEQSLQLLHGFDNNGELWKGHECTCKGYECTVCGTVIDASGECCR